MTDNDPTGSELIEYKGVLQKLSPRQDLVKPPKKRLLLIGLASIMVVSIGVSVFSVKSDTDPVIMQQAKPYTYVETMNPVVSSEINTLKGQFVGLISGSIESKLKTLEHHIRNGAVKNSLGTIQELKNDLNVLRAYSVPQPVQTAPQANVSNEQLIQEISHLRKLIYLTITSCSLMIAAVVGVWFRQRKKLPHQKETVIRYLGKN